jgi:hypothetical protein
MLLLPKDPMVSARIWSAQMKMTFNIWHILMSFDFPLELVMHFLIGREGRLRA